MHVDPVVREPDRLGHDQRHGQEVAVAEPDGGVENRGGRRRVHRRHERAQRHRRHDVRARRLHPVSGRHHVGAAPTVSDAAHRVLEEERRTERRRALSARLPHHAGAELRVVEVLDQRGDLPTRPQADRLSERHTERQILDALSGPVGGDLIGRHAPDLLGVGLEERPVQPTTEARGHPPLERLLLPGPPQHAPTSRTRRTAPTRPDRGCAARSPASVGSRRTSRRRRSGSSAAGASARRPEAGRTTVARRRRPS